MPQNIRLAVLAIWRKLASHQAIDERMAFHCEQKGKRYE